MTLHLDDRDILQINTGLIAGALVFLTLSSFTAIEEERLYRISSIILGLSIIFIFSYSSLLVMFETKDMALTYMKIGFVVIIIGAGLFLISAIPSFDQLISSTFPLPGMSNQSK